MHISMPNPTAVAQLLLAIGHFLFATTWPGTMCIRTLLVGLGYGAHRAVIQRLRQNSLA